MISEWGVPVHDDRRLFEFLILEGAQAGLSWNTILQKREAFRTAFDHFDPASIARYDARNVRDLLSNSGIIRNRLKIQAAISNAQAFLLVQKEVGSFDEYIWQFVKGRPIHNRWKSAQRRSLPHAGLRGHESGPETPGVHIRRLDDLLCVHASHWNGQRSYNQLLSIPGASLACSHCPGHSS